MEEDLTLSEPIEFALGDKVFVYDFAKLTVLQVEISKELIRFKHQQRETQPESFHQLIRSRGVEFVPMLMSYLLREKSKEGLRPFNIDKAEAEIHNLIKDAPASIIPELERCMNDFFIKERFGEIGQMILSTEPKKESYAKEILLQAMITAMSTSDNKSGI